MKGYILQTKYQMSKTKAHFPFLRLPPELRNEVYRYTLPDETDKSMGYHCPTIFKINRQIYTEASRVHYAKTYTIYVSKHGACFLKHVREYGIEKALPLSFPYHKIKALRIHIARPMFVTDVYPTYDVCSDLELSRYSPQFEANMSRVSELLRTVVKKEFPLRKLIIDAWSPCAYIGVPTPDKVLNLDGTLSSDRSPSYEASALNDGSWNFGESLKFEAFSAMHTDICGLFDMLRLNNGTTQTCEIVLGAWTKNCPETIQAVRYWGHAALCHDGRKGDNKEELEKLIVLSEDEYF